MSGLPPRIRQKRERGWRKPPEAMSVARPSPWGNPEPVEIQGDAVSHAKAVSAFCRLHLEDLPFVRKVQAELRGRPLMCFCSEDLPCHATVLLETANAATEEEGLAVFWRWLQMLEGRMSRNVDNGNVYDNGN